MNLGPRLARTADLVEAGGDDLLERQGGVDDLEVLLADIVGQLGVDDWWGRIGHVACAARTPLPHHLGRRFKPETGERNSIFGSNGLDRLALLLLRMHGIDDYRLPSLQPHQRTLAADGIDLV